ncbi:uncharacterized protein BKA78DRAFT_325392, partial [Phyllosticta capitalensis]|uniref:uncharacterized protein n=1 Tax=Phyllosticta capitalensis TaxID=121624 RepID=UPI00312D0126
TNQCPQGYTYSSDAPPTPPATIRTGPPSSPAPTARPLNLQAKWQLSIEGIHGPGLGVDRRPCGYTSTFAIWTGAQKKTTKRDWAIQRRRCDGLELFTPYLRPTRAGSCPVCRQVVAVGWFLFAP